MRNPEQTRAQEFIERPTDVTYAHNLSGNFTFLSEEGERISGYSCEEVCRMNIADLLDPEIAAKVHEQIIRDVQKCVGAVYEIDLIAKDGRHVPLEVSTRVAFREGKPIEVQGIAIPSVIRNQSPTPLRARWANEDFFFGGSSDASDIIIRIS
jgi:two-component system, cell cycle sensor histidine kinase and response regulator CckA